MRNWNLLMFTGALSMLIGIGESRGQGYDEFIDTLDSGYEIRDSLSYYDLGRPRPGVTLRREFLDRELAYDRHRIYTEDSSYRREYLMHRRFHHERRPEGVGDPTEGTSVYEPWDHPADARFYDGGGISIYANTYRR